MVLSGSLRRFIAKLFRVRAAVEATLAPRPGVDFFSVYNQPLTRIISFTGDAMAPTLNAPAAAGQTTVERLLVRLLQAPLLKPKRDGWCDGRSVFPGDVVAFHSPLASTVSPDNTLVRRIAAVEGQELVTDDPQDAPYVLPPGWCWVLADNEALAPPHVIDSRSFGPLPASHILGRILYYGRPNDHGRVQNSESATFEDAFFLETELDVDELTSVVDD